MPEFILYLFKANLSILLCYLGYRLLLRQLTFYTLNRYFLLFGVLFSLVFPLVDIRQWFAQQTPLVAEMAIYTFDWQPAAASASFSYWALAEGVFWMMALYFAFRVLVRLASLWRMHRRSLPASWRLHNYRHVLHSVSPFSFWRTIYLHIEDHQEHELQEIFDHEKIHVEGLHTIDILLGEVLLLFCWFNPGAWLLRRAIRENLEFITDRSVLRGGVDKKAYQYNLLRISTGSTHPELANGFNFKYLKRRITMMNSARSSCAHLGKYVFALPAIAIFALAFTVSEANQKELKAQSKAGGYQDTIQTRKDTIQTRKDTLAVRIQEHGEGAENEPLYIIDGMPAEKSSLDNLDPNTINNVTVIKNAAANAVYGSRAANGVVLITTKKSSNHNAPADTPAADTIRVIGYRGEGEAQEQVSGLWPRKGGEDPLWVVDGVEASGDAVEKLSPDDIEAINVWKGKSATDKYGEKGAKGAIEITTKQQSKKKTD